MKMLDCFKAFAMAMTIAIATTDNICANENSYPLITNFRFSGHNIGWEGDGYWEGIIDHENKTITFATQRWIENIDKLPAIFELDGDGVAKVGGKLQFSGATVNDFRKDVVYTFGDAEYTVKFVSPQASGLSVIRIDTKGGVPILDKENYVNMTFTLTDSNNPKNDVVIENTMDGIRGRGNDSFLSQNAFKKSYRIKFDKKNSLFGLERAKSWVLIAQYRDPTLLFNAIAFELGNRFDLPFNHSFNFVELYMNGEYKGNYLLTEQNQVNPGRVNIDENEGWLVNMDGYYDEEPKFITTNYKLPVIIKSPEIEPLHISNSAYDFVIRDVNKLSDSLASANFPENGYRDLINMDTFIDFLMINEIVDNKEIKSPNSTYLYKNKSDAINMGPLWDFDCGYGYEYNKSRFDADNVYHYFNNPNSRTSMNNFFKRFFYDPIFLVKYKELWNKKYQDIASIGDFIDKTANRLEKSAVENFKTWWYKSISTWWHGSTNVEENNFTQEVLNLKTYLTVRTSYLNSQINKVEVLPTNKDFGTAIYDYSENTPTVFTLVSYGDMKNLSATLKKEELSGFEVSTKLSKTTTGNGGYLATISVKPKNSLPAATSTYRDTLILSGINQAEWFSIEVPLAFAVNEATQLVPVLAGAYNDGNATTNQAVQTLNGINLTTANNATLEIFNLKGSLISRQKFSSGVHAIQLWHLPKGMYIVKVSFGNEKQILRMPVR